MSSSLPHAPENTVVLPRPFRAATAATPRTPVVVIEKGGATVNTTDRSVVKVPFPPPVAQGRAAVVQPILNSTLPPPLKTPSTMPTSFEAKNAAVGADTLVVPAGGADGAATGRKEFVVTGKADSSVAPGIDGGMMVPVIGEDEELEECTFMPREYRGQQDNALRKWSKQDLATKGTGGVIGGGNFAKVLAGMARNGSHVAIKIIARENEAFGSQDALIAKEIDCMCKCAGHGNVVGLHGSLKTPERALLIMPLATTDVATVIQEQPLREDEARSVALQLMSALEHVHAMRIVHRDIKPANLLLTADKTVLLADFGMSDIILENEETLTGLCGTKPYLSPEQVNDQAYTTQVDMWAAGVVIYETIHGSTPFCPKEEGDNHDRLIIAVDTDNDGMVRKGSGDEAAARSPPAGSGIEMRYNAFDELERDNIRAGVFEVDSGRVGAIGEDMIRKLMTIDPEERMTAHQASEHPWLGGEERAMMTRATVGVAIQEHSARQAADIEERQKCLRSKRTRRVPREAKAAGSTAPATPASNPPTEKRVNGAG